MMRVKSGTMALIVVAVFVVGIGGSMAFNLWKTTSEKEPAKYREGAFAGQANPADIRGSYALSDIVEAFGIPLADLAKAFGADKEADPAAFQVKELEGRFPVDASGKEIGTDSVRLFVARYKGLPMTPAANTGLPAAAAEILLAKGNLDAAAAADVKARTVVAAQSAAPGAAQSAASGAGTGSGAAAGAASGSGQAAGTGTPSATDRTIKGKTTFKDLLDWGVSKEDIEKVLKAAMGATGSTVRDFCAAKGLEFETVKTALQVLVDSKK